MINESGGQHGSDRKGEISPPLSHAEELMRTHPDITVIRDMIGHIRITQTFPDKWRHIGIRVKHEEGSQRSYPSVILTSFNYPSHHNILDDLVMDIRQHGLKTIVKVHVKDDEEVMPEVGYNKRLNRYPSDFSASRIRLVEKYSFPTPAQELVSTALTGLEMLKAYGVATQEQRARIEEYHTGYHGWSQIVDSTRSDMDEYIAGISPFIANAMKRSGFILNRVGTKAIYALNALNKVTYTMLPQQMPPAPKNRREPARRTRPPG